MDPLLEAIKGWRKTKSPRFATLAEFATARALPVPRPLVGEGGSKKHVEAWNALLDEGDLLDVPRLLATVGAGNSQLAAERLLALAKLNDPRVVSGTLALLGAPPFRARSAMVFFRTACSVLTDSGDLRVRAALEDLASRYRGIIETTVSEDIAALLRRTALAIDQVKPGPLPAAMEKKCAELEALFDKELGATSRASSAKVKSQYSDDALLAAIYAAPDDDAPRLVFADTLTERGNPRGEFISLQLASARGAATIEMQKRERELGKDPKRRAEWGLPLSQGGDTHLGRGFADQLTLDPRTLKHVVGSPALRTAHSVDGFNRGSMSVKLTNAFLFHEHALHLKHVGTFPRPLFDALTGPMNWESVDLAFPPEPDDLARLPKLKVLEAPLGPAYNGKAFAALGALEAFHCTGAAPSNPAYLTHLKSVKTLYLSGGAGSEQLSEVLASLPKLRRLELRWSPRVGALKLPALEELSIAVLPELDLPGVLDTLPALKVLELDSGNMSPKTMKAAMTAGEARWKKLTRVRVGAWHFTAPFTAKGELSIRHWSYADDHLTNAAAVLGALPKGLVKRVVLRPYRADSTSFLPAPPPDAAIAQLQASTTLPVDVEWY